MIRARLIALREQRAALVARAATERLRLAGQVARAEAALQWLERGRAVFAAIARQPLLVAVAVAALAILRPRRVFRLLAGGWSLWRFYRRVRPLLSGAFEALAVERRRPA